MNDKGKSTRQARGAAMQNPVKRQVLDGVYMPPKRYNRSLENLKPVENLPDPPKNATPTRQSARLNDSTKDKENVPAIPFREQFPVDAREIRFKDKPDFIMKEPEQPIKSVSETSLHQSKKSRRRLHFKITVTVTSLRRKGIMKQILIALVMVQ
jgi:hypothetical protein